MDPKVATVTQVYRVASVCMWAVLGLTLLCSLLGWWIPAVLLGGLSLGVFAVIRQGVRFFQLKIEALELKMANQKLLLQGIMTTNGLLNSIGVCSPLMDDEMQEAFLKLYSKWDALRMEASSDEHFDSDRYVDFCAEANVFLKDFAAAYPQLYAKLGSMEKHSLH